MFTKITKYIASELASAKAFRQARRLSRTSKRLDVAAAQIAHLLSLDKTISVKNKACLEVGGGWIFSHALVLHLLGAKHIVITDIAPIARPRLIVDAIRCSSLSTVRDILSPYEDHEVLRGRIDTLLAIKHFDLLQLAELGIEYRSPVFLDSAPLTLKCDFIFSHVVLQYLTEESLHKMLRNLKLMLNPDADMLHTLHLEDILPSSSGPFGYLKPDPEFYKNGKQRRHGNRIRFSVYDNVFKQSGFQYSYLFRWYRRNVGLPAAIDPEVKYVDEDDLRTSHFCVHLTMKGGHCSPEK